MNIKGIFVQTVTLLLIALWGYTALSKLFGFEVFQAQLSLSPIFKITYPFIAVLVPCIELILVALLIFDKTKRMGLGLSALLLTIFTGYLAYILTNYNSNELPCTCGGFIAEMTWAQHIIFNVTFIILAVSALYFDKVNHIKHSSVAL
ncbi:hypothetical protein ABIE26_002960 [Pedobacter africanus]|uniref:MauE/DoxX family redox-associated membrane protein n=1 Tax=Pedobacter africanus TaxID=151894 RepID=UPI003397E805